MDVRYRGAERGSNDKHNICDGSHYVKRAGGTHERVSKRGSNRTAKIGRAIQNITKLITTRQTPDGCTKQPKTKKKGFANAERRLAQMSKTKSQNAQKKKMAK